VSTDEALVALELEVRAMDGTVTGTVRLDPEFFAVQPNVPVMHQVVTAQRAAARAGTQSTKTRAEVSGGGAKPFKQKGTGRARQGSTRAPHYAGGGIALGPKPRKYRQRTPRKMVQLALRGALSDRAGSGRLAVIDAWEFEIPNTKAASAALGSLGIEGRSLVVLGREDEFAYKSLRNLEGVDLVLVGELAAYDILCAEWLVFSRRTLPGNSAWVQAPKEAQAPEGGRSRRGTAASSVAASGRAQAPDVAEAPDAAEDLTGAEGSSTAEGPTVVEAAGVAEAAGTNQAGPEGAKPRARRRPAAGSTGGPEGETTGADEEEA